MVAPPNNILPCQLPSRLALTSTRPCHSLPTKFRYLLIVTPTQPTKSPSWTRLGARKQTVNLFFLPPPRTIAVSGPFAAEQLPVRFHHWVVGNTLALRKLCGCHQSRTRAQCLHFLFFYLIDVPNRFIIWSPPFPPLSFPRGQRPTMSSSPAS